MKSATIKIYPRHAWIHYPGENDRLQEILIGAEYSRDNSMPHVIGTSFTNRTLGVWHATPISANESTQQDLSTKSGVPVVVIASLCAYVAEANKHAVADDNARIEQGRRDWAAMPPEQQDALNDYALRTEGHGV